MNNEPLVNTDIEAIQTSVTELVEVIKGQEEIKLEEKLLNEEQSLVEKQVTEEQLLIDQEQENLQQQADEEFRTEVLNALNAEAPIPIDYTEQLNAITEELNTIKEYQNYVSESDHVINLYGMIIIPGCLIVFGLWKMIKAFI